MRQVTATEKYRAVQEGKMAKREFVRQMRQAFPNFISNYNGFDDSVQVLKNKGLIYEAKKKKKQDVKVVSANVTLPYSLDALERGIRTELEAAGLMAHEPLQAEDYFKAEKKAKDNLAKNPTHYLDLLSGDSKNVDKHDKEVEVKRGEGKVDTFNGLVKANLKEAKELYKEGRLDDLAEKLGISLERLQNAVEGIKGIEDAVIDELETEVGEVMGYNRRGEKEEEPMPSNYTKAEGTPILKEVIASAIGKIKEKYGEIPGINSIIKDFVKTHAKDIMDGADPIDEFDNFVSVNYDRLDETEIEEKKGKDHDKDGDIDSDDYMAAKDKAIKKAMGKDVDEALDSLMAEDSKTMSKRELAPHYMAAAKKAGFSDEQAEKAFDLISRFMDKRAKGRRLKYVNYGWAGYEDLYKNLADILNKADGGGWEVKNQGSWYGDGSGWQVVKIYPYDNTSENDINEKAMDKEEQLKEAIKNIIKNTLTENMLNEAATNELAKLADSYGGFKGMQVILNDLENIVTDIQSYHARTQEKLQSVFDKVGQVENEEGLKVGGFLAPAIESAFLKDLRPVTRKGFMNGVEIPKVKFMPKDIETPKMEQTPKQTIFTPVNEKK